MNTLIAKKWCVALNTFITGWFPCHDNHGYRTGLAGNSMPTACAEADTARHFPALG